MVYYYWYYCFCLCVGRGICRIKGLGLVQLGVAQCGFWKVARCILNYNCCSVSRLGGRRSCQVANISEKTRTFSFWVSRVMLVIIYEEEMIYLLFVYHGCRRGHVEIIPLSPYASPSIPLPFPPSPSHSLLPPYLLLLPA